MFNNILSAFSKPKPAPLPEPDARLALGALMVRVAKSDHTYKVEEISRIDRLLGQIFGLNPIEAAKMRATCEKLDAQVPDMDVFANLIRENVDFEQRVQAHEALWQVMVADGIRHDEEMQIVLHSRDVLGLSENDCLAARGRASME